MSQNDDLKVQNNYLCILNLVSLTIEYYKRIALLTTRKHA